MPTYTTPDGRTFDSEAASDKLKTWLSSQGLTDADIEKTLQTYKGGAPQKNPIVDTAKQFGMGAVEGGADIASAFLPTETGPEPDIRGKSLPENYELPRKLTTADKFDFPNPTNYAEALARQGGYGAPMGLLGPFGGEPVLANAAARAFTYGAAPAIGSKLATDSTRSVVGDLPIPIPYFGEISAPDAAGMLGTMWTPGKRKITPFNQIDPLRGIDAKNVKRETGKWPSVGNIFDNQAQKNRELYEDPSINRKTANAVNRGYTKYAGPGSTVNRIISGKPGGQPGWFDENFTRVGRDMDNLARNTFADPRVMGSGTSNTQLYNDLVTIAGKEIRAGRSNNVQDALGLFRDVNGRWVPTAGPPGNPTHAHEVLHDALFRNTPLPNFPGTSPRYNTIAGRWNMSGEQYQRLRTRLHSAAENSEPTKAKMYRDIADALDNGVENTLQSIGSQLAGQWAKTRGQYRALLTMQKAIGKLGAGETDLTPDLMKSADEEVSGQREYLRGNTPFANFTEAAGRTMQPLKLGEVPEPPGFLERNAGKIPFGKTLYTHGPKLASAAAGATTYFLGRPLNDVLEAMLLGLFGSGSEGRWRKSPMHMSGTVGTGPIAQAYGRNQILPNRPEDATNRKLHAVTRALMLPREVDPEMDLSEQPPPQ